MYVLGVIIDSVKHDQTMGDAKEANSWLPMPKKRTFRRPTFETCVQVADALRIHWSVDTKQGALRLGFEAALPPDTWIAFGPSKPGTTARLMGGADVIVAGFKGARDSGPTAFVADSFISSYASCSVDAETGGVDGVCDDITWAHGSTLAGGAQLLSADSSDGSVFIEAIRPLDLTPYDLEFDHPINPDVPTTFIWAVGRIGTQPDGQPEAAAWRSHALLYGKSYGELRDLILTSPPDTQAGVTACRPGPFPPLGGGSIAAAALAAAALPSAATVEAAASPGVPTLLAAHAACMLLAWAVAFPLAVAFATCRRRQAPPRGLCGTSSDAWFLFHSRLAGLGGVLSVAGFIAAAVWTRQARGTLIGLVASSAYSASSASSASSLHVSLGFGCLLLLGAHVFLALLRPPKPLPDGLMLGLQESALALRRRAWEAVHRVAALLLFALAAAAGVSGVIVLLSRYHTLAVATPQRPPPPPSPPPPPPPPRWRSPAALALNGSAPAGCTAFPAANLGDGWCDDDEVFNSAACHFDFGDCCDGGGGGGGGGGNGGGGSGSGGSGSGRGGGSGSGGGGSGGRGGGGGTSPILACRDPSSPWYDPSEPGKGTPRGAYPAPRNFRYGLGLDGLVAGRAVTDERVATTYNNYYEWSLTSKEEAAVLATAPEHAEFFRAAGWPLRIRGRVTNAALAARTLDVSALVSEVHLEERVYAHRCVEAWSIVVPWVGFPLAKLVEMAGPAGDVRYVLFESHGNRSHGRFPSPWPWPYTEALTIEEARNELAFLAVGMYQRPLPPQSGAPIRLVVPWKYGFKSIKAVTAITFATEEDVQALQSGRRGAKPPTFWSSYNRGAEFGFWANVNPEVPHPRWSQARERVLADSKYAGPRIPTRLFNGYAAHVAHLYEGLQGERLFA